MRDGPATDDERVSAFAASDSCKVELRHRGNGRDARHNQRKARATLCPSACHQSQFRECDGTSLGIRRAGILNSRSRSGSWILSATKDARKSSVGGPMTVMVNSMRILYGSSTSTVATKPLNRMYAGAAPPSSWWSSQRLIRAERLCLMVAE